MTQMFISWMTLSVQLMHTPQRFFSMTA
uniref:MRP1 n=1 Tax=Arundo donax TaxID=35708 RepID=A0A0A9GU17_ARUDO